MTKYIVYDIENIEPIKVTATVMQSDNQFSKSYIGGSKIRGAFLANYISKHKVDINTKEHRGKLLQGGIKFLNAYPVIDGERALPFPKCYYGEKDNIKKFNITKKLKVEELNDELDESKDYERIKSFEFAKWNINRELLNPVTVEKISNLHIRKEKENNKIFRYEAIKEGTEFKGIIVCEEDKYIQECKEVLKSGHFYIGGSKGSGYGLCKISNIKEVKNNPEIKAIEDELLEVFDDLEEYYEDCEQIVIAAASDIIYRNSLGIYKSFIDKEYLKDKLGLEKVTLRESFVETEFFTGFNNKWGYRLPNVSGIKAGSILVYDIEGELDSEKVKRLMKDGVGERKSEGFGRILVLEELPFKKVELENDDYKIKKVPSLNKDEKDQMKKIVDRIYKEILKDKLSIIVLNLNQEITGKEKISANQWGKLYQMMFLLEGLIPNDGQNKVRKYFDNINNKKLNRELMHCFNRVKVKGEPLQQYILNELNNLNERSFYEKYEQSMQIGNVKSSLTEEYIYSYKVNVLKELFRLQLREEVRKGEQ